MDDRNTTSFVALLTCTLPDRISSPIMSSAAEGVSALATLSRSAAASGDALDARPARSSLPSRSEWAGAKEPSACLRAALGVVLNLPGSTSSSLSISANKWMSWQRCSFVSQGAMVAQAQATKDRRTAQTQQHSELASVNCVASQQHARCSSPTCCQGLYSPCRTAGMHRKHVCHSPAAQAGVPLIVQPAVLYAGGSEEAPHVVVRPVHDGVDPHEGRPAVTAGAEMLLVPSVGVATAAECSTHNVLMRPVSCVEAQERCSQPLLMHISGIVAVRAMISGRHLAHCSMQTSAG